jgi:hypothetical protein
VASTTLPVQIINPVNAPSTVNIANPVQNRDEPGRNPYHGTVALNPSSTTCPSISAPPGTLLTCIANFPAVPAGKRLVITYASGQFALIPPANSPSVQVGKNGFLGGDVQFLPTFQTSPGTFLGAGPVTFYVEAGEVPSVFMEGQSINQSDTEVASITGYLISLP